MTESLKEIRISEDRLRKLMQETVKETLTKLGVDSEDPLEMQRDFQYLRDWRRSVQAIRERSIMALIATLVTGALALVYMGFRATT